MEIGMVAVDSIGTIDRIFNPYDDTRFRNYIKEKYDRTVDILSKMESGIASEFLDRSRQIFDRVNSLDAIRRVKASMRSMKGIRTANMIVPMESAEDLQAAGLLMQRYCMAEPEVRKAYLKQRIDGYSDSYANIHGEGVGSDHYDYRRVVDGVYLEAKDDKGNDIVVINRYYEELTEGDRDLDVEEKSDILSAWDIMRMCLAEGIDPTNRLGGNIG